MTFHYLPAMNARQLLRILYHIGFVEDRQKGSQDTKLSVEEFLKLR